MKTAPLAVAEDKITAALAVMVAHLEPHKESLESLWGAMPDAFKAGMGRAVDKADPYDLVLCHAAISHFQMEES